jgi:DNA-binding phage protein
MPLTRDFKATVKARADRDPAFRKALLSEAVEDLLRGNVEDGKANLRAYINATIGFEQLAKKLDRSAKSMMRMLAPNGNPQADNLFQIIAFLQKRERITLKVTPAA